MLYGCPLYDLLVDLTLPNLYSMQHLLNSLRTGAYLITASWPKANSKPTGLFKAQLLDQSSSSDSTWAASYNSSSATRIELSNISPLPLSAQPLFDVVFMACAFQQQHTHNLGTTEHTLVNKILFYLCFF